MAACSSQSVSSYDSNSNDTYNLPMEVWDKILFYSNMDNPLRLGEVMSISKMFHEIVNKIYPWEACIKKWGITDYASKASGPLSSAEVAKIIGVPMINVRRMTKHMITLNNALILPSEGQEKRTTVMKVENWLRTKNIAENKFARWQAISNFFETCGLPVKSNGVVVKELPDIIIGKKGVSFPKTPGVRIVKVRSVIDPKKKVIKSEKFKGKEARRNMFLTNKFLELSLYTNSDNGGITALGVARLHLSNILKNTPACLDAYYKA